MSINSCGRGSGDGDGPLRDEPRWWRLEGVWDRGRPREGMGGVPRSSKRELGRRTRDGTGIDEPIVRLPSIDARGARGVEVGMWIELCPAPVGEPNVEAPAIRDEGRGIAV